MSYQFNATFIIIQFMFYTGLIVVFAIYFIPILHDILFDSNAAANIQTPFLRTLLNSTWSWSIIFFIAGIAGNIVWFVRAIQARQTEVRQF